ncbi:hypothetical protein [Actinomadura madurae]|uniref:hypothetical protein n=1 Tax=Actinomadura madurae TaxID=1993 RepID=UPI0020D20FEF|nr:hypothetical protein [Actinomadura madurae]MCQ0016234.1 hypothetical protein [Actinomadura madurae]
MLATYLLVRALDRDERRPWRWFAGYAPAVADLGLLHLHGALLLAAHGVTLLLTRPRAGIWVRWLVSAVVAALPLAALAIAAQDQKRQVTWLPDPSWKVAWTQVQFLAGGHDLVAPVVALVLACVVVDAVRRARRSDDTRPSGTASLSAVALPWAVLPTLLLLAVSALGDPMFYFRYTVFCLPAVALLAGGGNRVAAHGGAPSRHPGRRGGGGGRGAHRPGRPGPRVPAAAGQPPGEHARGRGHRPLPCPPGGRRRLPRGKRALERRRLPRRVRTAPRRRHADGPGDGGEPQGP